MSRTIIMREIKLQEQNLHTHTHDALLLNVQENTIIHKTYHYYIADKGWKWVFKDDQSENGFQTLDDTNRTWLTMVWEGLKWKYIWNPDYELPNII